MALVRLHVCGALRAWAVLLCIWSRRICLFMSPSGMVWRRPRWPAPMERTATDAIAELHQTVGDRTTDAFLTRVAIDLASRISRASTRMARERVPSRLPLASDVGFFSSRVIRCALLPFFQTL